MVPRSLCQQLVYALFFLDFRSAIQIKREFRKANLYTSGQDIIVALFYALFSVCFFESE